MSRRNEEAKRAEAAAKYVDKRAMSRRHRKTRRYREAGDAPPELLKR